MKESIENIKIMCVDCSKTRKEKMQEELRNLHIPLSSLVGKFVKKGFIDSQNITDHMWVKIDGITDTGKLTGVLNNDPMIITSLQNGDRVEVDITEIEQVL